MNPTEALQEALASEHAALYVCGVLGARTSQSAQPTLYAAVTTSYQRHRARRDHLMLLVSDAGAEPAAAAPAYEAKASWRSPSAITRAAIELEATATEVMASLVARTAGSVRLWASTELTWSAVQQVNLGQEATAWPGAPELD